MAHVVGSNDTHTTPCSMGVLTEQPQWPQRSLAQHLVELRRMSVSCMRHTTTSQRHCTIIVVHLNMYVYTVMLYIYGASSDSAYFVIHIRGNSYTYIYTLSLTIMCNESQYYTTYNVVYAHKLCEHTVHVLSACMYVCCM